MKRHARTSFLAAALMAPAAFANGPVLIEYERDAVGWLADAWGAESYAFDEFYPGIQPGGGCLVGPPEAQAVTLALSGGTVTVTALDENGALVCPVRDGGSGNVLSDGSILLDGSLVLEFDPPISAFYGFYGSLEEGRWGTMTLYDPEGALLQAITGPVSSDNVGARGHGFVSPDLVGSITLTTSAVDGNTLLGAFVFLEDPEGDSLGTVHLPGYGGPSGDDVNLDFGCVFGPIDRVANVTQGTNHFSITEAIGAASDGDELVAQPTTYYECVDFQGKVITLRSTDPDDPAIVASTVIRREGNDENQFSIVACTNGEGPDTILDGFTISEGQGTDVGGDLRGGGMYISASSPTVRHCRFMLNWADHGGGMYVGQGGSPTVSECVFESNGGLFSGGGMYVDASTPTIDDCLFDDNFLESGEGAGMANVNGSAPTIANCTFESHAAQVGGGMYNDASSPVVVGTTFALNEAFLHGGGMANANGSSPTVEACTFRSNDAGTSGGGVHSADSSVTMTNCVFFWNDGGSTGGGLANDSSTAIITNCSFAFNVAFTGGGAIANDLSVVAIDNCIIGAGDAATEIEDQSSTTIVSHSNVNGGWAGVGNIDMNPMFVDVSGGDLRVLPGAAGIDAGDNLAPGLDGITTDRDGMNRFFDDSDTVDCPYEPGTCGGAPIVDMGAYEHVVTCDADLSGDGIVGFEDLLTVLAAWGDVGGSPADLDFNGVVDFGDLIVVLASWGDC